MKSLSRVKFPAWTFPFALLFICLLAYAPLINKLGFYWDDWAKTLVHRIFGLSGYWSYYAGDRPLSGWTHIVAIPIIGDSPLAWHIYTLLLTWVAGIGMWWLITRVWPFAKRQAALAAALFVVYPVFTQTSVAVTFHQQWLQYGLFFFSTALMIEALRKPKWFWWFTLLAMLMEAAQMTVTEYFMPLEMLKPILLLVYFSQQNLSLPKNIRKTILHWLPYAFVLAAYLLWRFKLMHLPNEDPYAAVTLAELFKHPLSVLFYLAKLVTLETFYVLVSCWGDITHITPLQDIQSFSKYSWMAAILGGLGLAIFFYLIRPSQEEQPAKKPDRWILQALVVGLIALLLGCSPAWLTGRQVVFDFHSNRYAMPAMFGASLMIVAVVDWLAKGFFQKVVVISILVGLSIGYQLRVENDYANIWSDQLNFYWQLYWRAPYIQPKTALVAEDELFPNQGLFSTSAAVNLIYPQPQNPDKLAYWVYSLNPRYTNKLPNMENTTYSSSFRTLSFTGVMPNSLVLFYNSDRANCLWILTPEDQDDPEVPALTKQFLKISNLNLISPEPVSGSYPPRDLYGAEPNHSWCYYYQKADLARQQNDWDTVVKMADAARQLGYSPEDNLFKTPHEWLVFIEGYVHANRWNDAQKLAIEAGGIQDGFFKTQVCGRWKNWTATTSQSPDQTAATAAVVQALSCNQ